MVKIHDRIKAERIKSGLLQQELANELKVSKQTISHWETGQRLPDILTIIELADIFNVSTDYLLCRTNNPDIIDSLAPELSNLIEITKDFPKEVIENINNMIISMRGLKNE